MKLKKYVFALTLAVVCAAAFVGCDKADSSGVRSVGERAFFLRGLFAVVLRRTSTKRFNGLAELPYEQVEKEGARRRAASRGNA